MKPIVSIRHVVFRAFAVIALAAGLAIPGTVQAAPLVMKIGTATINDINFQWMKIYAALVDKNSGGRIKVHLYPVSQLGSIPRMIEGTQFGSIQGYVGPPEFLSGIDKRYQLLTAPGLFKNIAHANRTLQDPQFNHAFLALGANKGLKGVGLFLYAPTTFNTRTPIRKIDDLAGKKIRVLASAMQMDQMRLLHATPVPMSLGSVLPSMQQGALDGVMAATPVFTTLHFYDVAKYIYQPNYSIVTSMGVISKMWYDKLPPDLQKVVVDAGQKASHEVYPWTLKFIATQNKAWIKHGGVFTRPTAAEHAKIMRLMRPIGAKVTAGKPAESALYDLLLRAAKRTE